MKTLLFFHCHTPKNHGALNFQSFIHKPRQITKSELKAGQPRCVIGNRRRSPPYKKSRTEASQLPQQCWWVKRADSESELLQFSSLLVKGYFENNHQNIDAPLIQRKIQKEMSKLKQRCQVQRNKQPPESICLVVKIASKVIGGCEIRLSEEISGGCPPGVPVADKGGFYIQNVVVNESYRKQGVGNTVMNEVNSLSTALKASALYTHVESKNEAAIALYLKHNFHPVKSVKQTDILGKEYELLLMKLNCIKETTS